MTDREVAEKIIELVGGADNINSAVHCVTRLRLRLKDESKADDKAVQDLDAVQGLVKKGGQYQIVLGPGIVERVHAETLALTGGNNPVEETQGEEGSVFDKFVSLVSSIFTPALGILAAAGILKGLLYLFGSLGILDMASPTFAVFGAIADAMFYFMPIVLGYTSMKKFGGNPLVGMMMGAVLVHPTIAAMAGADNIDVIFEGTFLETGVKASIFGLPLVIPASGYATSVLPIIFITAVASKIEKFCKKHYHDSIAQIFVPMTTIFVGSVVGLLVVGPIISMISSLLTFVFSSIIGFSPVLYQTIMGGIWQILVVFGLHWAVVPLNVMQLAELQNGSIDHLTFPVANAHVSFAQAGAVLAVYFKTKDKKLKNFAMPAFITAIFGITETAIYGVTLPRKKDFMLSCVAGAAGGLYLGIMDVGRYNLGAMGIFAPLNYINPADAGNYYDVINFIIACIIGFVLAFVLVTFFGYKEPETSQNTKVSSPVKGQKIDIKTLDDDMFKNEIIGSTTAYKPASNQVTSPIDGHIVAVYPTKHAFGIKDDNGLEVLVHIGIDTVELDGNGFESKVKINDYVKTGDRLCTVDFEQIEAAGYDTSVILVITHSDNQVVTSSDNNIAFEIKEA